MKQVLYWKFYPQSANYFDRIKVPYQEGTKWIIERYIKVEPFEWEKGYGVTFHVMEIWDYSQKDYFYIPGIVSSIKKWDMFDRDYPEENALLAAINSGDLRGRFATDSVYHLFVKYFDYTKVLELVDYFPEYVKMRHQADYDSLEKEEGRMI